MGTGDREAHGSSWLIYCRKKFHFLKQTHNYELLKGGTRAWDTTFEMTKTPDTKVVSLPRYYSGNGGHCLYSSDDQSAHKAIRSMIVFECACKLVCVYVLECWCVRARCALYSRWPTGYMTCSGYELWQRQRAYTLKRSRQILLAARINWTSALLKVKILKSGKS